MSRITPVIATIVAISLSLMSCHQSAQSPVNYTESGYEFFHHIKYSDVTPQDGDYAYCYIDMRKGDQLVSTNRTSGKLAKVKISNGESGVANSPIIDALKLMSVGDSLTVHYPIEYLANKPKGFESATYIAYDLKLVDIKSDNEYHKDFAQRWKKATSTLN